MTNRRQRHQPPNRSARVAPIAAALLCCAGCGDEETIAFDEISRLPIREELVEVDLGSFIIPIPIVLDDTAERFEADNLIQLDFELFAVVEPAHASKVEQLLEQREGRLRDEVIRVCRNTARDDVLDSEWATLKAHLLDATRPLLGGDAVRRIGASHVLKEEL